MGTAPSKKTAIRCEEIPKLTAGLKKNYPESIGGTSDLERREDTSALTEPNSKVNLKELTRSGENGDQPKRLPGDRNNLKTQPEPKEDMEGTSEKMADVAINTSSFRIKDDFPSCDVGPPDRPMIKFKKTKKIKADSGSDQPNSSTNIQTPIVKQPLARVRGEAPDFRAKAWLPYSHRIDSDQFKEISLSDYTGKYLVLFFYPMDFTFVCPTEIIAFSDRIGEFSVLNAEVVACSVDSHFCHMAWTERSRDEGGLGEMNIPILSDITKKISADYGVLLEDEGVALRGLFIIDKKGIIRQITINDLSVGRNVDEVLRLIKAFQTADKYGNVCPANWKEGDDMITPDVRKSRIFFKKKTPGYMAKD